MFHYRRVIGRKTRDLPLTRGWQYYFETFGERPGKGCAGFIFAGRMGDFVKIGQQLQKTRRTRGIKLEQVSSELCIQVSYLKAIENGELEALPCRTYVLGFVRSYSDFLELDSSAIINDLRAVHEGPEHTPCRVQIPEPVHNSRIPALGLLAAAGVGILFMVWNWTSSAGFFADAVTATPEVPARLSAIMTSEPSNPAVLQGQLEVRFSEATRVQYVAAADAPLQEMTLKPLDRFLVDLVQGMRIAFQDLTGVSFTLDGNELDAAELGSFLVPFTNQPADVNTAAARDAAS